MFFQKIILKIDTAYGNDFSCKHYKHFWKSVCYMVEKYKEAF